MALASSLPVRTELQWRGSCLPGPTQVGEVLLSHGLRVGFTTGTDLLHLSPGPFHTTKLQLCHPGRQLASGVKSWLRNASSSAMEETKGNKNPATLYQGHTVAA